MHRLDAPGGSGGLDATHVRLVYHIPQRASAAAHATRFRPLAEDRVVVHAVAGALNGHAPIEWLVGSAAALRPRG